MSSAAREPARAEPGGDGARPSSLGARTLGGIGWSGLAAVGKALLTLLVLAVLSRLLAPADFGLIGIAWILVDLARRVGQTGIGHALIQRAELTDRHIEAGFTLSMALGAAMAAAIWLFAPHFARMFGEPIVSDLLRVLCVAFVIGGVCVVPEHRLRRDLRFRQLMVVDLLSYAAGYGLVAVALAFRGFGVWALVWGEIMRMLVRTAAVTLYSPPRLRLRLAAREAMDLVSPGAGLSLTQAFDFIVRNGGYFVVGRWLGAMPLGFYTRADRLASLPFEYLNGVLFEVMFPAMAERQQRVDRLRLVHLHGIELLSLAMLPVSALMFVSAPEIVAVVLGGQWGGTVSVLGILALAIPFQTCGILNTAAIRASGAAYREAWRQAAHALLVVLGAWFGSRWGLEGVAIAVVGAQIVAFLLTTRLAAALLGLPPRGLLRCCLPALWTAAWATFALWLAAAQLRAWNLPVGPVLFLETLAWAAAAVAALYWAPPFARLRSVSWALAHVPFEALGAPGRGLRNGLVRLTARHDPDGVSSSGADPDEPARPGDPPKAQHVRNSRFS